MSPSLILSALLSTTLGLIFHLLRGGSLIRLLLLIVAAWIGFAIGQLIGSLLDWPFLRIGNVYALHGLIGSIILMILVSVPVTPSTSERRDISRPR
jgi:hypothetical protein